MATRAVSNPVGVVLILGMTVIAVGALLVVGGAVIDDTRADAERSQMENSMSAFSSKASLVGLGESGHQRFSLGRVTEGQVDVREDEGRVHVYVEQDGTNKTVGETSMGALVYENDGREIAYQGGGVWARQGDFSRMLSPPEFHYRSETLTFPIVKVTGSDAGSGDIRGTVRSDAEPRQLYPDPTADPLFINPLADGTVYVEIESDYCRGWQSFFEARSQGNVHGNCEDEDTVVVDLTVSLNPTFGSAVTSNSIYSPGNANVSSSREGRIAPSASPKIEDLVDEHCEEGDSFGSSVSSGTHCTEDPSDLTGLTINTGDGDVDVIINDVDDLGLTDAGEITVNGGNTASVYFNSGAGIDISGGDSFNVDSDPEQFLLYVHSDTDEITFSGNVDYVGGLYAPSSRLTGSSGQCDSTGGGGGGNVKITGSVIVDEFCFQASSTEFTHDDRMNDIDPELGADTVKYLHVSENEVRIDLGS